MRTTHFLTVNEYSRPGKPLLQVNGVVWHWVANPGTSPEENRNFFENRKEGKTGYGSAHYIIGIDGEILQCIPEAEMAYHVGADKYLKAAIDMFGPYPNGTTIGIELCHPEWNGKFTEETKDSCAVLTTEICKRYHLRPCTNIVRHFDVTGKICPKWFVEKEDEFIALKGKVQSMMDGVKNPWEVA